MIWLLRAWSEWGTKVQYPYEITSVNFSRNRNVTKSGMDRGPARRGSLPNEKNVLGLSAKPSKNVRSYR
jgi:hypothetical protein